MSTYFEKIEEKQRIWKLARWGKFTGSEIHKLLSKGTGSMFGKGALTYIDQVACEACTSYEDKPELNTYDVKMGKINEPVAFAHYKARIGVDALEYYGGSNPVFKEYVDPKGIIPNGHVGVSADCVATLPSGGVSFGGEIKCLSRDSHWYYIQNIKDQDDLKAENLERYAQIQLEMMAYDCDLWHLILYNEYFSFKSQMYILEISPDKNFQLDLKIRMDTAIKIKLQKIENFKKQFS